MAKAREPKRDPMAPDPFRVYDEGHPGTWRPKRIAELRFYDEVELADLREMIYQAGQTAKRRGILGRMPYVVQPIRSPSKSFYLAYISRRFLDVLAGVLAGQGWCASVVEWERTEHGGEPRGEASGLADEPAGP